MIILKGSWRVGSLIGYGWVGSLEDLGNLFRLKIRKTFLQTSSFFWTNKHLHLLNKGIQHSLSLFICFWRFSFHSLRQKKKNNGMPRRRGFLLVQDFPKKESVWNLPPANYLLPWSSWTRATSITGVTKTLFKENQMPGWWVFPIHFSQKSITFHHFPILGAKNHQKIWMKLPPAIPDPQKSWTRTNPRGISPCHH